MTNLRLLLAYDGTDFTGWQIQASRRTVQGVLEEAIRDLTGETPRVLCAGRTDSGVHAHGQVANFETKCQIPIDRWRNALQFRLPDDVIVREVTEVPPRFHATYSPLSKRYRYLIHNSLVEDLILRRFSWRVRWNLDVEAMQAGADRLLGHHDFRSFESNWPNNKITSTRNVYELKVFRTSPGAVLQGMACCYPEADPQGFIAIEIEADGFLYNMVRIIAGTLVNVGRGYWTPDDVERILMAQDRQLAGDTSPAQGLFLVHVKYPENEDEL